MSLEYQEAYRQAELQRKIGERKMADAMGLRECPFCGEPGMKAMERSRHVLKGHFVICSNFEGDCPIGPRTRLCDTKEQAAEVWNKREPGKEPS
jgi:hypothetical protein